MSILIQRLEEISYQDISQTTNFNEDSYIFKLSDDELMFEGDHSPPQFLRSSNLLSQEKERNETQQFIKIQQNNNNTKSDNVQPLTEQHLGSYTNFDHKSQAFSDYVVKKQVQENIDKNQLI
ncbi:UNKNOWN [Stylonychia lemnae]|uniref:Uncharacterized protein n=1 Tax=Stylonychia lemnae TaxID=5949 RepID=A0A078AA51_STYLE|nr:UNKNOWN [Stylonychia lemnae]|eukprot:CDW79155.1 UNKNOWN [Stylonychia lemnae]